MKGYAFLFTGKWIGWFLVCCLASALCVYFADWQMDRNTQLDARNQLVVENYDAAPLTGQDATAAFTGFRESETWQPVELLGQYLPEKQLLARNRPQNGKVGYEVLVPFRAQDGTVVLLDRGWIPTGSSANGMPDAVPPAPNGTVRVTARVHAGEVAVDRGAPAGQIASIDLAEAARTSGLDLVEAAYGKVAAEDPAPAEAPQPAPRPEMDYGPHLSYSYQWYAFAVLVFVAYGYAARQQRLNDEWDREYAAEVEARLAAYYDEDGTYVGEIDEELVIRQLDMADDMPSHLKSLMRPARRRHRSRPTGEEEEDALLDAWERGSS